MLHSPSMLAPLRRHDRINSHADQVVVTIHDTVPWSNPEALTPHGVTWHKTMAKRAHRYADAVVVPTHAVAQQLSEILDFGDRVRVIGGAVGPSLDLPLDAQARAERLELPDEYVLAVGTLEPRKGLGRLIQAMGAANAPDLPLLVAGPEGWGGVDIAHLTAEAGIETDRVRALGYLSNADLAVVLSRATVFVYPSLAEGFGLPVLEAMHLGTPVIHTDVPALVEVAADAGIVVELADESTFVERLAAHIARVAGDAGLRDRLSVAGLDRASAFSWRGSAEKVWQLHADL
jgi:glycosyltransferase involved in cell wall biosynthesis